MRRINNKECKGNRLPTIKGTCVPSPGGSPAMKQNKCDTCKDIVIINLDYDEKVKETIKQKKEIKLLTKKCNQAQGRSL